MKPTMEEEYARWLDGRRAVFRNLKGIRNDLGLVSTKDLGMVGVDVCSTACATCARRRR